MAGVDERGQRNRWNTDCNAELVRSADQSWSLRNFAIQSGEHVVSADVAFQDISKITGLELHESKDNEANAQKLVNLRQLTQSGGISVFDHNDDGYWDVLAFEKIVLWVYLSTTASWLYKQTLDILILSRAVAFTVCRLG